MWKFILRGLRDTFERGRERAVSAVVENCQGNVSVSRLDSGATSNEETSAIDLQQNNKNLKKHRSLLNVLNALNLGKQLWSGVYCFSDWKRHHAFGYSRSDQNINGCPYKGLFYSLIGTALAQPLPFVPRADLNETPSCTTYAPDASELAISSSSHSTKSRDSGLTPASNASSGTTFDSQPDLEAEYNQACLQFSHTLGNIENKLGVLCARRGLYDKALPFFKQAVNLGDQFAYYNLALCYESGLGVEADSKKAVYYYKEASDLGHPLAAYNLGIYYAQGRGGLPVDLEKAEELFVMAANQGVMQAKAALEQTSREMCKTVVFDD